MKYLRVATLSLAGMGMLLFASIGTAQANGNGAGIIGSPHDFAADTWQTVRPGEICRVCHVPHDHGRSGQTYTVGLLWNRQLSTASYTMYNAAWSSSLDNAQSPQPDGIAKLCLGCHDGTIALDEFDKNAAVNGARGGVASLGDTIVDVNAGFQVSPFLDGANVDLRGTHPLSIAYNGGDTGLNPDTDPMGTSGDIASVLDNGKVQCSTCHDVHDGTGEAVAGTHLLRVANNTGTGSGLCLTCHDK